MEMMSSGMENQKAMRQPQVEKVAAFCEMRTMPMTSRAANMPTVAVVWIQLVARPRFSSDECSAT